MTLPELMTTHEVAEFFRVADSTVRYWRQMGYGPPGVTVGKRVLYTKADVLDWWRLQQG